MMKPEITKNRSTPAAPSARSGSGLRVPRRVAPSLPTCSATTPSAATARRIWIVASGRDRAVMVAPGKMLACRGRGSKRGEGRGAQAEKAPACTGAFSIAGIPARLVPEYREQNDDRQRNSEQPEQCAFTKAHVSLLCFVGQKTPKPG